MLVKLKYGKFDKKPMKRRIGFFDKLMCLRWGSIPLIVETFLFASMMLLLGCSSRDAKMEQALTQKLVEFRRSNAEVLDLRTVFGDRWEKVCLQGPYEDQEHFEQRVGRKVHGFKTQVEGNVYVFWVFYRDGKDRWARVPRMEVMNRHPKKGTWCTGFENPYLYAADSGGTRKYYFVDK